MLNMLLCPVFGVFFISIVRIAASREYVTVETTNGPLRGEKRGNYNAFEGIPYAKAPVGGLRLAPSQVNDAQWDDPRDAIQPGPVCLQWSHFVDGDDRSIGEEDCLFMNIYTPSLGESESMSTIFFIHGGAFMFGQGHYYQADHVLEKQLVLVTFNYRLGPLGFLSTEDDIIPGNFGLKDQVTALKWLRQNIGFFGGNSDNITIVGYSAGSASVQLHYLSPMSRGLFKNGIGHSGSALNPWVLAENSAEKAKTIAQSVGCSVTSSRKMLECLREKPARAIVRAVGQFFNFLYNPFSPLGVVVEKQTKNNPKPFLVEHPYSLMERGKFYRVPLLLSVSEAEGLYPGAEFISKSEYLDEINDNWNRLLPSILDYKTSLRNEKERCDEISQAIRERYLGRRRLTENSFRDLILIISNRLYFAGVVRSAKLMQVHTPVYLYYGKYKSKYALGEYLSNSTKNHGIAHGEDVLLVFKTEMRDAVPYTEEELVVARLFIGMYEQFARDSVAVFGDYNIPRMDSKDKVRYLEVNYPKSEQKLKDQLSDEDFWNQIDFGDAMPVDKQGKDEL
ncbi:venom carboxylesterase-6-like [Topomyia yanbarensis]|uniref:venom carboxylesterase-6-like n=1 Tax=Topomyia yanbarensis TaxID=2498891 RepID=UPI00273A99F1|nr:venom carboxylesterase-6-like [Topomyia yanbarensis]